MTNSKLRRRLLEARPDVARLSRSRWRPVRFQLYRVVRKRGLIRKLREASALPGLIIRAIFAKGAR